MSILSILFAGSISAQEATTSPEDMASSSIKDKREEIKAEKEKAIQEMQQARQDVQNKIQEAKNFATVNKTNLKEEIKGKKTEIKMAVQELKDQKAEEKIAKVEMSALKDFEITIKNLDNLSSRINSRLEKFEASGTVDVATAKDLLAVAYEKINTVKISVSNFRAEYSTTTLNTKIINASSTDTLANQLKKDIAKIKSLIKEAHSALVDVVNSIEPGQNKEATSTE